MKLNFMVIRLLNRKFAAAADSGDEVTGWMNIDEDIKKRNGKDASILHPDINNEQTNGKLDNNSAVIQVLSTKEEVMAKE